MAKLEIIKVPDPVLRTVSEPIAQIDDATRRLANDMFETMYAAPGIGLAAIQVAVPKRLIVIDVGSEDAPAPLCLINPEIERFGDATNVHEEGCLSIPDVHVEVERPAELTLRYLDLEGREQQLDADGLLATAIQHEVDHLDGKLIIDYLSRLKRDVIVRRFRKQLRGAAAP